jgi:hypothetical protein
LIIAALERPLSVSLIDSVEDRNGSFCDMRTARERTFGGPSRGEGLQKASTEAWKTGSGWSMATNDRSPPEADISARTIATHHL